MLAAAVPSGSERFFPSSVNATRGHRAGRLMVTEHPLGMPMLNACGLSETWLQKTCGEVHWQLLGLALGRPSEQWVDRSGRRVYAAFSGLQLSDAKLERAEEGRLLEVRSELLWLGASQAWSRHRLRMDGQTLGELDMVSVFVSRRVPGRNTSVRRAEMPDGICDAPSETAAARLSKLREDRHTLLHGDSETQVLKQWRVTPCPRAEFNGAGLLYFPSFSAIADRALWQWGAWDGQEALRSRACTYVGNADVGEMLCVNLLTDSSTHDGTRRLQIELRSAGDLRPLASIRLALGQPRLPNARAASCSYGWVPGIASR
jgi:probable biosynthetic protein (TIGR04099 family)